MTSSDIKRELIKQVTKLPPHLQTHLLDYAKQLSVSKPQGISGRDLLSFSGTFSTEEATLLSQAIEEGCERVNVDEW